MEVQRIFPIPAARNRAVALLMLTTQAFLLFALPAFILPLYPASGWLLIALSFTATTFWALIHEAIHRLFAPSAKANDHWGRILCIAHGNTFSVVKFGHLMHHRYNRDWESEFYDPRSKSYARAALEHYAKMCGGIYFIALGTSLLFLLLPATTLHRMMVRHTQQRNLHNLTETGERFFFVRDHMRDIRTDTCFILALYGASFYAYGTHWLWLALFIFARAFAVSFMDNIYHYATPADNSVPAKEILAPPWLAALSLNGNRHQTHHHHALTPWPGLPLLGKQQGHCLFADLL